MKIPLHGIGGVVGFALVDACDYERVASRRWHRHSAGYAHTAIREKRGEKGRHLQLMHRFVLGLEKSRRGAPIVVDHINHDRLDNRRSNLRLCSHAENLRNRNPALPPPKGRVVADNIAERLGLSEPQAAAISRGAEVHALRLTVRQAA